jgi:hypothetical protein
MAPEAQEVPLSAQELLHLAAEDNQFYCAHWFPKAFRTAFPDFEDELWYELEHPDHRYCAIMLARGFAKTTRLRAFTSKRIAYGISRTILFVSESQDHAKRSVRWLKRQVMFNKAWADFYQLRLGSKKTDEWLEIVHGVEGVTISIVAVGITGQTRGVNIDDFRPDLIVVDDPSDEENTATLEQRTKISNLFFGALAKSLAPPSDSPAAKMVLLQTPLHKEDLIMSCIADPQWHSLTYGCFDEEGKSRWAAQFPTQFLLEEKKAHIARNQLSLWLREMECKLVSPESSAFNEDWLSFWSTLEDVPEVGFTALYIDPVPPPSDRQLATNLKDKDFESISVVRFAKGRYYLCEQRNMKGHNPTWTLATFWELVEKWKVDIFDAESTAYQQTLKWLIEESMKRQGRYVRKPPPRAVDRRKKAYRIIDTLLPIVSHKALFVNRNEQTDFISQYTEYPNVAHDDALECAAGAVKLCLDYSGSRMAEILQEEMDAEWGEQKLVGYAP